jgi:hypothetical protein
MTTGRAVLTPPSTNSGAALAVPGKMGAVFTCLGPAPIGIQLPWAEVHDLAARHGFQGVELTTSASSTRRPRSAGRSPLTWTPAAFARAGSRCRNAQVRALVPEERLAAVAASLEGASP